MLDFNLKQLEVFVAVAELNSFTRAAEELYLTQSTVSAHISGLERALGRQLFTRNARRRVTLTQEGKRIYPRIKEILSRCRSLQSAWEETEDSQLLLGASTVPAQYVLPQLLTGFLKQRPDSRYLLKRGDSSQISQLLLSGEIRIGFVGTALEPQMLEYVPLVRDRLVLVTANVPRYQKFHSRGAFGRELLEEPIVAREEGSGTERTVASYLRQIGFSSEKLNIVARIDNPEAIKKMVERGMGVTILSELSVHEAVESGKLLSFDLDAGGLERNIYMAFRRELSANRLEQAFMTFVRKQS